MDRPLEILYLEDSPSDAGLTERALRKSGLNFNMVVVETEKDFINSLQNRPPTLVLSDHSLPGFNSMEAFKIVKNLQLDIPFILITGSVSEEFAVDCLLAGVDDYILKSNLIRLPSSIDRIISKRQIKQENEYTQMLLRELQTAYTNIEIKNKEITDSINYAKRIQDAILPPEETFEDANEGFVFYRPRDIVSGDLYWFAHTRTTDGNDLHLKIISVADCTGHGVPGAFMSLLVSVLLNETLKNPDINSPSEALSYVNKKLPVLLNKNHKEIITDGLDIALCALDPIKRILYFSGANRPLWIMRKLNGSFELNEYKGTKASIGANTDRQQVFEGHEVLLQPGERIYLFTDGLTDQFGGANAKKMGRQKLREVLTENADLNMKAQKDYIKNFFNTWQGTHEQVDDVLLVGIEIK